MATQYAPEAPSHEPVEERHLTLVSPIETIWGVELPADISVTVEPDTSAEDWMNAHLINIAWKTDKAKEDKVTLRVYPRSGGREVVVSGVERPGHWGIDYRDVMDQAAEFRIGLAAGLAATLDEKVDNPFGLHHDGSFEPPSRISFVGVSGPAEVALVSLQSPESAVSKTTREFSFAKAETSRGLGEMAIPVRPAPVIERQMPPRSPSMPRWG